MDQSTESSKKPAVMKVKPILKSMTTDLSGPNISRAMNPPIRVPLFRTTAPSQYDFATRLHTKKIHCALTEKVQHIETLRQRISNLLQRAANVNSSTYCRSTLGRDLTNDRQPINEMHSHLARLLSSLMPSLQSEETLQTIFQRILVEIDKILVEYIEEKLRNSHEHNEHQIEDLRLMFEHLLRQKECAYQQEILELHGRIKYIQEELNASRRFNEVLEEQLASANSILAERSEEMGRTMEEITELRGEVEQLRLYRRKHKLEMENIHRIRQELNKHKMINKEILEEFAKIENERDEFLSELNNSLMKMRHSNLRRHEAIEEELNEFEKDFII